MHLRNTAGVGRIFKLAPLVASMHGPISTGMHRIQLPAAAFLRSHHFTPSYHSTLSSPSATATAAC